MESPGGSFDVNKAKQLRQVREILSTQFPELSSDQVAAATYEGGKGGVGILARIDSLNIPTANVNYLAAAIYIVITQTSYRWVDIGSVQSFFKNPKVEEIVFDTLRRTRYRGLEYNAGGRDYVTNVLATMAHYILLVLPGLRHTIYDFGAVGG